MEKIGWGGTNYSGTKIGDGNAWEPGFIKPDFIWVPSIAVSGIKFYHGDAFPEWKNSLLVSSLKYQYLSVLHRKDNKFTWITSEQSRDDVQIVRAGFDAILTGGNTLRNDNPRMNARVDFEANQPTKNTFNFSRN